MSTLIRILRRFVREPGSVGLAVLAPAVGISVSSVLVAVIWGTLGRGAPVPGSERIFQLALAEDDGAIGTLPIDLLEAFEGDADTYDELLPWLPLGVAVGGFESHTERVSGAQVSAALFDVVGTPPLLGRVFSRDEVAAGAPVVVIGEELWRRGFGGDPKAIGRPLSLYGKEATLIGVMPKSFLFPYKQELWFPLDRETARASPWMQCLLVAGKGSSPRQILTELEGRRPRNEGQADRALTLTPYGIAYVPAAVRRGFQVAIPAMVGLMLLMAFNTTQIQLARGLSRRRELSIRAALGAGRGRLVVGELVDTAWLTALGGALGWIGAHGLLHLYHGTVQPFGPFWIDIRLDGAVFLSILGLLLATSLAAGWLPAWAASKIGADESLRSRQGWSRRDIGRFKGLAVIQVAVALVLSTAAFALLGTVERLASGAGALDRDDIFVLDVSTRGMRHDPTWQNRMDTLWPALERALMELPEIDAVSFGEAPSVETDNPAPVSMTVGLRTKRVATAQARYFAPGIFDVLQQPLLVDRVWRDPHHDLLISRRLAREISRNLGIPAHELLGRRLSHPGLPTVEPGSDPFKIAAIAPDLSGSAEDPGTIYLSPQAAGAGRLGGRLLLRSRPDAAVDLLALRHALGRVHPEIIAGRLRPLSSAAWDSHRSLLNGRLIFSVFGASALIFSSLGLWGLWELDLRRRRHQLGVRQALGASPGNIFGEMLKSGLKAVLFGSLLGLPGAWIVLRLLQTMHPIPMSTVSVIVSTALTLAAVGCAVGLAPSLRASRIDPSRALRED